MNRKFHFVILKNELPHDHASWEKACKDFADYLSYRIVDITGNDWLDNIQNESCDFLLAKPGALSNSFKQLYDERIYILERVLDYKIFPSAEEIFIYENKRFLSFWLQANKIPHPKTFIFYLQSEALRFIETQTFPIVAKTNIGASGSGVVIIKNKKQAIGYINGTFLGNGAKQRTGPNLAKGNLIKRGLYYVFHPSKIANKLNIYKLRAQGAQTRFVILQQYIKHDFEWRVVRIGDSFFAHKKLIKGEKASGSLLKGYDNPPLKLLDFVKQITDKYKLYSQAIDIFESDGGYLVNEMQCIFGQSDPYQMKVDRKIGRYVYKENFWQFEEGDFNKNESYNLRIQYMIDFLNR